MCHWPQSIPAGHHWLSNVHTVCRNGWSIPSARCLNYADTMYIACELICSKLLLKVCGDCRRSRAHAYHDGQVKAAGPPMANGYVLLGGHASTCRTGEESWGAAAHWLRWHRSVTHHMYLMLCLLQVQIYLSQPIIPVLVLGSTTMAVLVELWFW